MITIFKSWKAHRANIFGINNLEFFKLSYLVVINITFQLIQFISLFKIMNIIPIIFFLFFFVFHIDRFYDEILICQ